MHTGDGVSVLPRLVNDRSIHAFISGGGAINGVPIAALMSNRPTTSAQGTQTAPDDPRQVLCTLDATLTLLSFMLDSCVG